MEKLIVNRSFVYEGSIERIKQWIEQAGYATEEVLDHDQQPVVLHVLGTGINIGYHRPLNEHDTGKPKVHLLNGPHLVNTDPESARRGLALYPKLYRRFRVNRR